MGLLWGTWISVSTTFITFHRKHTDVISQGHGYLKASHCEITLENNLMRTSYCILAFPAYLAHSQESRWIYGRHQSSSCLSCLRSIHQPTLGLTVSLSLSPPICPVPQVLMTVLKSNDPLFCQMSFSLGLFVFFWLLDWGVCFLAHATVVTWCCLVNCRWSNWEKCQQILLILFPSWHPLLV